MPDLVSTAGSALANSFLSADDADTYLDGRLNSGAWDDASSSDKDRSLIEATRELNLYDYQGTRVDGTQALAWPRSLVHDPDDPNLSYFDSTEIPQRIKDATSELALEFLKAGTTDIAGQDSSRTVISETVGPISVTYSDPSQKERGIARYPRVLRLIQPLMESPLVPGQLRLIRG